MSKGSLIKCLLSLVMIVYLACALSFTSKMAVADTFKGVVINVADSNLRRFVTAEDVDFELDTISRKITSIKHADLNTLQIESRLLAKDNIESANCMVLNDGSLRIDVLPLIPVARVFDTDGKNYYINRSGKRMKASTRYRMDVPVITGSFHGAVSPTYAFPLVDFINSRPDLTALTSAVKVEPNSDLILVPTVRGHVVNIGDTSDLQNKFARLKTFYKNVMPAKGWEYYDTISVKWRGQIVAHRRFKKFVIDMVREEEHIDLDDEGTMLVKEQPV